MCESEGVTRPYGSPVDIGPELRAQHVHRLHAAPVQQPHRPLPHHLITRAEPAAVPAAPETVHLLQVSLPLRLRRPLSGV